MFNFAVLTKILFLGFLISSFFSFSSPLHAQQSSAPRIDQITNNITYILDAIEAKWFTPILNQLGFRDYDDTTYLNEENGALPYNENIITPLVLSRTPEFAYSDGQSFYQLYNLVYNNYETYLGDDNIHLNSTGRSAFQVRFIESICKYIFEDIVPDKIIKVGQNLNSESAYFNAVEVQ